MKICDVAIFVRLEHSVTIVARKFEMQCADIDTGSTQQKISGAQSGALAANAKELQINTLHLCSKQEELGAQVLPQSVHRR